MRLISNHWKLSLLLFPIIGTCVLASPGGQRGFFQAWYGVASAVTADPYELLEPTAYWYPSVDLNNTDRILGIASTNTVNAASVSTNGWEFNGTSQYLDMGYPTEIEIGTSLEYTMAVWVYPTKSNFGAVSGIMGKNVAAGSVDRWGISFFTSGGNKAFVIVEDQTAGGSTLQPAISVSSNNWYHLVQVIERGPSNGHKFYIDGVQIAQGTISTTNAITFTGGTTRPFLFGRYDFQPYYWKGYLDQAAVWQNRALTSNEVFQLFEDTKEGRK